MKREELEKMKVAELKAICKDRGIKCYSGKNLMKKDELIDVILQAEDEPEEAFTEEPAVVETEEGKEVVIDMVKKMPFIENAAIGTIVAFRLPNGKVKSAKIIKRSTPNRKLMVETSYGVQYVIKYDDVVWVRAGDRWPSGVYRLLKGY